MMDAVGLYSHSRHISFIKIDNMVKETLDNYPIIKYIWIGAIISIITYIVSFTRSYTSLEHRISAIEKDLVSQNAMIQDQRASVSIQITDINKQIVQINQTLTRIVTILEEEKKK